MYLDLAMPYAPQYVHSRPPILCAQYVSDSSKKTPICQRHGKSQSLHVCTMFRLPFHIYLCTQEGKLVRISILQIIMQFYAEYRMLSEKKEKKTLIWLTRKEHSTAVNK